MFVYFVKQMDSIELGNVKWMSHLNDSITWSNILYCQVFHGFYTFFCETKFFDYEYALAVGQNIAFEFIMWISFLRIKDIYSMIF